MNLGLEELYRRHLPLHDDEIVGYYDTGLGYSKPERSAEAEQESFAICQATTDDEVFHAGDHDRPFALQSISKVFVYGLALEPTAVTVFWCESEWSRAVTPRRPSSSTCGSALAARAVPDDPARQGHQAPGAGSLIPRLRNACRNARETVAL